MALASLDDVKRILRFTDDDTDRDAQLQASLDAVESWAEETLGKLARTGSVVEDFFDVGEDATLHLSDPHAVVTLVEVFGNPDDDGQELSLTQGTSMGPERGYDLTDEGSVILRPLVLTQPFEGAVAERLLGTYSRVSVHFQTDGQVPRAVTEGIALLAAGYWKDGPRVLSGMKREKIGDYEYELAAGSASSSVEAPYVARAMFFLRPFFPKQRVQVC